MLSAPPATAIVTGASDRIGRAVALHLAKRGYRVAITYHTNREGALATQKLLEQYTPCTVLCHDLATLNNPGDILEQAHAATGAPVHCVIYAASFFEKSTLKAIDTDHMLQNFWVHLFSPILMAKALHLHMTHADVQNGNFVVFCDQRVYQRTTTRAAYELSKKSLAEFTRMAAKTFAPTLRCNSISPGPILQATTETDAEFRTLIEKNVPLKRQGSVEHILQALDFLLQCDYVTGIDIPVDGGEHL
ncbi:SDR family oxidoreductase [Desulfurispirillum indicum]|uniref:Short-chain dehydrogenase/reductase SDR n=1 Tax=Desulfurispirillum indicum (strain ATCC BAA-1389 / DSM 22839 / S5) TaxID=653733 RepID=E6W5J4_DESIS|nr:SDR family oxidoreductase [Desulfurispirillum indicum]ADU66025.1 short-chain dehydrogenase/reductase SDR [Desulfurispirillum indicum S5]UCZ57963.1 SDR family oxidoreductase [Desulfurispirillum indicum]